LSSDVKGLFGFGISIGDAEAVEGTGAGQENALDFLVTISGKPDSDWHIRFTPEFIDPPTAGTAVTGDLFSDAGIPLIEVRYLISEGLVDVYSDVLIPDENGYYEIPKSALGLKVTLYTNPDSTDESDETFKLVAQLRVDTEPDALTSVSLSKSRIFFIDNKNFGEGLIRDDDDPAPEPPPPAPEPPPPAPEPPPPAPEPPPPAPEPPPPAPEPPPPVPVPPPPPAVVLSPTVASAPDPAPAPAAPEPLPVPPTAIQTAEPILPQASGELFVQNPVETVVADADGNIAFDLSTVFASSDPDAQITRTALVADADGNLVDVAELGWLSFDPETGLLTGRFPEGVDSVEITMEAIDQNGNRATMTFTVTREALSQQGEEDTQETGDSGEPGAEQPQVQGKLPLSEQIRLAIEKMKQSVEV
jgi:hypothetical protein